MIDLSNIPWPLLQKAMKSSIRDYYAHSTDMYRRSVDVATIVRIRQEMLRRLKSCS